ncbi:MAG: T9SS type A sorting domain-containing protein [Flavobacteriales bacterium]|nr:T9SS type A sorting domain-containing protein [Flavobacteriales bacterium]MBK9074622.1 T9SS type A sorting domain-containing protein [Flavobacteriales bacterium]
MHDAFNGMCLTLDGGACMVGNSDQGNSQVYLARIGVNGDSLWTKVHGTAQSENAFAISLAQDGGFLVTGYRLQSGNQYDMLLMRTDDDGELLWQRTYGSPWSDNAAFATELPSGRIVLAGAERASANVQKRPVLYMLEADGDEVWTVLFDERTESAVFYAIPLLMEDGGFAISGGENVNGTPHGLLVRTDSLGELLWKRWYSTNDAIDNYTYDVRRTLDGGFILAGTAFDSALVSQDAWLVKVDSFGCLIPGCQVFDGLEEQVTDLRDALEVFPNPASDQTNVRITLPVGTKRENLRLALVSTEGKLVQEEAIASIAPTHVLDLARCAPGLYFVHLLDGARWLSGTKVVVE